MPSLLLHAISLALLCSPPTTTRPRFHPKPTPASPVMQAAATGIDLHAVALIKQMESTYQAMKSLSVEFEETSTNGQSGAIVSNRAQLQFRRPGQLSYSTTKPGGTARAFTDGVNFYLQCAGSSTEITQIPFQRGKDSPFAVIVPLRPGWGSKWLNSLLLDDGFEYALDVSGLVSVKAQRRTLPGGEPVMVVSTTSVFANTGSWEKLTLTIGAKDHLLYEASRQTSGSPIIHSAHFHHQKADPDLTTSDFMLPQRTELLPIMRIVNVTNSEITLNKGGLDRVAIGDELEIYLDDKFTIDVGTLVVTQTGKHDCKATVIKGISAFSPDDVGIVVRHRTTASASQQPTGSKKRLITPQRRGTGV